MSERILVGHEQLSNKPPRTQVYMATHDEGDLRLPLMQRSFISLKYDGIWCEDLNLIATLSGDRMQRNLYGTFADTVTNSDVVDGQFYWNTSFTNNTLQIHFSTDGITEMEYNEIKRWLKPGKIAELILAENPYRAILARVSDNPPNYSMLPFEQHITVNVAGHPYLTSTTIYKGDIDVTFTMDDPFWYSIDNILDYKNPETGRYESGCWKNAQDNIALIYTDPDAIKVIAEDSVPTAEMITASNMLLGNNTYIMRYEELEHGDNPGIGNAVVAPNSQATDASNRIDLNNLDGSDERIFKYAVVGLARLGNLITEYEEGQGIDLAPGPEGDDDGLVHLVNFYYPGTAPAAPTISFTLTPQFNTLTEEEANNDEETTDSIGYIVSPKNSFTAEEGEPSYNTITIESANKKELRFTTPSIYTAYNQALSILAKIGQTSDVADLRKQLRDGVNHYAVRAYAIYCVDESITNQPQSGENTNQPQVDLSAAISKMNKFFRDANDEILPAHFSIDCRTGQVIGTFRYRQVPDTANQIKISEEKKEEVGDMIRSNYLLIEDRNYPTDDGYIVAWSDESEAAKLHSHRLYHDVENGLSDFSIKYNYYYY